MATRARSGGTGYAVAIVLLAIMFVLSVISTMIFHSRWQDAIINTAQARTELDRFAAAQERRADDVKAFVDRARDEKDGDSKKWKSVVDLLVSERAAALAMIHGDAKTIQAAKDYAKSSGVDIDVKTLTAEIDRISADLTAINTQLADKEAERAKAAADLDQTRQKLMAMEEKYQKQYDERVAEVNQLGTQATAFQTSTQQTIQGLEQAQDAAAQEHMRALEDKDNQVLQLQAQIRDLDANINKLKALINKPGMGPTEELNVDAEIMSIIPQDNLVTINLGERNRLLLGMTFEVFDKKRGVSRDQFGDVRGKGTIEVVNIKEFTTECRIVRLGRGETILEGDLLVNVVYDKDRIYKFYVFGDFDIDSDGRSTPADTRRIRGMIEQWGGVVTEEMSYDVDFVVLGRRPELPATPVGADPAFKTPEEIEAEAAIQKKLEQYIMLEGEARTFRIPILNQNRFLTLVGFYNR